MKPTLPRILLATVLAAQIAAAAFVWEDKNDGITDDSSFGEQNFLQGDVTLNKNFHWTNEELEPFYKRVTWVSAGQERVSLTGSGSISADVHAGYVDLSMGDSIWALNFNLPVAERVELGEGVTMENIYIGTGAAVADIRSTLKNCCIGLGINNEVDIREAGIENCSLLFETGMYGYADSAGTAVLKCNVFNIGAENSVCVYGVGKNVIDGDVELNSGLCVPGIWYGNSDENWNYSATLKGDDAAVYLRNERMSIQMETDTSSFDAEPVPYTASLTITGEFRVSGLSSVTFCHYHQAEHDITGNALNEYALTIAPKLPGETQAVFICGSISEESVNNLKPFAQVCVTSYTEDYSQCYTHARWEALTDKAFYAEAGTDGMVYVYLRDGSWSLSGGDTSGGNHNSGSGNAPIMVTDGSLTLGSSSETTPSTSRPVMMQGGTADASLLENSLLNNTIFRGQGGTVKLSNGQMFSAVGTSTLDYDISGGNIVVEDGANVTLGGKSYTSSHTTVSKAALTVSSGATLGRAAHDSSVVLKDGARMTNYGRVLSPVTLEPGSTMLNEGIISDAVTLSKNSTAVNNGEMSGCFNIVSGASAYGSGSFAETKVMSGGLLHVGNSPGYQYHRTLSVQDGATLSFSVDGLTAASPEQNGAGTHSLLKVDSLTLQGKVNVALEVTSGILAAGDAPFSVTLLEAQTTEGEGTFSLQLDDADNLLEEEELFWSDGTLTLSAVLSREPLMTHPLGAEAVHMANTMWASAAVVQDFARLAESQSMIGMPNQSTWWAGAFGSFINVSDYASGFRYDSAGYAVGLQHAFTESFRAGFALGQSFGTYSARGGAVEVEQMGIMPGVTAQYVRKYGQNSFGLNAHIACGIVENEAEMYGIPSGTAEWDDTVLSTGIRASWNIRAGEHLTVSPFIGINCRYVSQDSYSMNHGVGSSLADDGELTVWSVPVGVTLRSVYLLDFNCLVPELTLAYVGDIVGGQPEVTVNMNGHKPAVKGYSPARSAFQLNAGVNYLIGQNWCFGAYYNLEARSAQTNQTAGVSVRYSF